VGTPKGRLTKLEQAFLNEPWAKVRDGVQVTHLSPNAKIVLTTRPTPIQAKAFELLALNPACTQ
jgi:hypothetical protein